METGKRGRPAGAMTERRRQVQAYMAQWADRDDRPTLARVARECGLCDYREARRIWRDLSRIGRA